MPVPKKTTPSKKPAARKVPVRKPAARKPVKKKRAPWRRWLLPGISFLLFGYGLFRVIAYYSDEVDRNLGAAIRQHKATATARIISVRGGKTPRVAFQFLHRGIAYERWQADPDQRFALHQCYTVHYDSTHPGRALLLEGTLGACPVPGMREE